MKPAPIAKRISRAKVGAGDTAVQGDLLLPGVQLDAVVGRQNGETE